MVNQNVVLVTEKSFVEAKRTLMELKQEVKFYRERKNAYKNAYLSLKEENESLKEDLVALDELASKQNKTISDLTEMCEKYSQYIDDIEGDGCQGCDCKCEDLQGEVDKINETLQRVVKFLFGVNDGKWTIH